MQMRMILIWICKNSNGLGLLLDIANVRNEVHVINCMDDGRNIDPQLLMKAKLPFSLREAAMRADPAHALEAPQATFAHLRQSDVDARV